MTDRLHNLKKGNSQITTIGSELNLQTPADTLYNLNSMIPTLVPMDTDSTFTEL